MFHVNADNWLVFMIRVPQLLAPGSGPRARPGLGEGGSGSENPSVDLHHIKTSVLSPKKTQYVHLTVVVLVRSSDCRGLYISYQKVNASLKTI